MSRRGRADDDRPRARQPGVAGRRLGDYERAARLGRESLDHYRAVPHREGITSALRIIGGAMAALGRYDEAQTALTEALASATARTPGQHRLPTRRPGPASPGAIRRAGGHAPRGGEGAAAATPPRLGGRGRGPGPPDRVSTQPRTRRGGRTARAAALPARRCRLDDGRCVPSSPSPSRSGDQVPRLQAALVPVLGDLRGPSARAGARPVLRDHPRGPGARAPGAPVTAVDSARCPGVRPVLRRHRRPRSTPSELASCAGAARPRCRAGRLRHRDVLPAGAVLQPFNGDAHRRVRGTRSTGLAGTPDVPGAADQPDGGRGSGRLHDRRAMAYLKRWAPRSYKPLELRLRRCPGPVAPSTVTRSVARPPRAVRPRLPRSRRTTSTPTSRTTTYGRPSWPGTRPSTTAWRASGSTARDRRQPLQRAPAMRGARRRRRSGCRRWSWCCRTTTSRGSASTGCGPRDRGRERAVEVLGSTTPSYVGTRIQRVQPQR